MMTRWIKFKEVLESVAATQNLDVSLGQLDSLVVQRRLVQAVNMAVDFAWKYHVWPDAAWLNYLTGSARLSDTFAAGSSVLQVYTENPRSKWEAGSALSPTQPPKIARWHEYGGTVRRQTDDPVWLLVRIPAPQFSVEARSTSTAYEQGEVVYDPSTGECWVCQKAHTNEAIPSSWSYWDADTSYSSNALVWHGGWLFKRNGTAGDDLEPHIDTDWATLWQNTTEEWCPVRLPHYLLRAVLAGARAWLDSPDSEAMERAMEAALHTEIHDRVYTRQQGGPTRPAGPRF